MNPDKRTLIKYIRQLEQFQNQLKEIDHEYSDKMMYAIHDRIVAIILSRHTPPYKFTKSADTRAYVCSLVSEKLYNKLDISDSRWKRLLNNQHDIDNTQPRKLFMFYKERLIDRLYDANSTILPRE